MKGGYGGQEAIAATLLMLGILVGSHCNVLQEGEDKHFLKEQVQNKGLADLLHGLLPSCSPPPINPPTYESPPAYESPPYLSPSPPSPTYESPPYVSPTPIEAPPYVAPAVPDSPPYFQAEEAPAMGSIKWHPSYSPPAYSTPQSPPPY